MRVSFYFIFILFISFFLQITHQGRFVFAAEKKIKKNLQRQVSFKMTLTGDLDEIFDFTGNLGAELTGEPKKPNPVCDARALSREALYREKKSIEIWLRLLCTFEGQKKEFKYNRFFISAGKPIHEQILPPQFEKLKKITLKIEDLEIKANQSK